MVPYEPINHCDRCNKEIGPNHLSECEAGCNFYTSVPRHPFEMLLSHFGYRRGWGDDMRSEGGTRTTLWVHKYPPFHLSVRVRESTEQPGFVGVVTIERKSPENLNYPGTEPPPDGYSQWEANMPSYQLMADLLEQAAKFTRHRHSIEVEAAETGAVV